MSEEEWTLTDPDTGGRKGQKLAQASTLDPEALLFLAEVGGMGTEKYERHNYLRGYDWSLSLDALHRHLWAFMGGEDLDPESGLPHMAHAAWHALALVSFQTRGLGTDDRFKPRLADWERELYAEARKAQRVITDPAEIRKLLETDE